MSDNKVEETQSLPQSPWRGMIEILQVVSLLMVPVAWLLEDWYRATAIGASIILGFIPFLLVQLPKRNRELATEVAKNPSDGDSAEGTAKPQPYSQSRVSDSAGTLPTGRVAPEH